MSKNENKQASDTLHVGLLVDESGSMQGNQDAVVGGINEFVAKLAADANGTKVLATLAMFDLSGNDPVVRPMFKGIPVAEVGTLGLADYSPRGATPLNDAVVQTIRSMDKRVKEGHRAMLVILTDGLENSSETPSRSVRKLILEREKRGWEFIYLGANQDAWAEGQKIGIADRGKRFDYDASPAGTRSALRASGERARKFRDAPQEYRAELMDLSTRIDEGDDDVKRRVEIRLTPPAAAAPPHREPQSAGARCESPPARAASEAPSLSPRARSRSRRRAPPGRSAG
jgi:uncharacterized protein YegL